MSWLRRQTASALIVRAAEKMKRLDNALEVALFGLAATTCIPVEQPRALEEA